MRIKRESSIPILPRLAVIHYKNDLLINGCNACHIATLMLLPHLGYATTWEYMHILHYLVSLRCEKVISDYFINLGQAPNLPDSCFLISTRDKPDNSRGNYYDFI
jgi:hypothetical protein